MAGKSVIINILKKGLLREKGILFSYLFGSQAYRKTNSESDVDIAVYFDEKQIKDFFNKRLELIVKISRLVGKETDIVILNTAAPFLKYVVLKEGKLIFEKDKARRIDFEMRSLNEYFDFRIILERYHQKILTSKL